jgi:hypothetical protein
MAVGAGHVVICGETSVRGAEAGEEGLMGVQV